MNMTIYSSISSNFLMPINLIFWGFVIVYVLHIFEESVLPEVFVEKMRRLYFAEYDWKKFFWFNTVLLILNISAVIVFEEKGGAWIVFPLSLMFERIFNGIYHLYETIISKKFSSGLLSSVISWILGYLVFRYSLLKGEILQNYFTLSLIIGFIISALMIIPLITGLWQKVYHLKERLRSKSK